jgi:ubiquitin conjugation factor E4 B
MDEYGFDPKFFLVSFIKVYADFSEYKEFIEFIIKDQRSFKINNFEKALALKEAGKIILHPQVHERFIRIVDDVKILEEEAKANQINWDDAPEEFLCPFTSEIMTDPVMLPTTHLYKK